MGTAVKKTISLPVELAQEVEQIARAEGKSLSAVVQEALRGARKRRLSGELRSLQGYWSATARERRLLTEEDLERYLGE
jgi:metal-responsive CopG/Arc/MetJ family transcriptional regulator